ncbi:MAG: ABC transporter ATP-binding protein [Alphaproteobacteria bacterium]
MLRVEGLGLALPDRTVRAGFGPRPMLDILTDVDFSLGRGETMGLVGESGSGKTSLGRTLLRLYRPTAGRILFDGIDITGLDEEALRPLRARMQIIFQDPLSALNPRQRIGSIVTRPLAAFGRLPSRAAKREAAARLLTQVGLPAAFATRFPHELSGGQRQRVGIARAIALEPELVVADEIVSGLDVSSQAQILALLRRLRQELGLALIFISHDLSVVRVLCDRVMVLYRGVVVEHGRCADVFARPQHPYTRRLLAAAPLPDVDPGWIERVEVVDEA